MSSRQRELSNNRPPSANGNAGVNGRASVNGNASSNRPGNNGGSRNLSAQGNTTDRGRAPQGFGSASFDRPNGSQAARSANTNRPPWAGSGNSRPVESGNFTPRALRLTTITARLRRRRAAGAGTRMGLLERKPFRLSHRHDRVRRVTRMHPSYNIEEADARTKLRAGLTPHRRAVTRRRRALIPRLPTPRLLVPTPRLAAVMEARRRESRRRWWRQLSRRRRWWWIAWCSSHGGGSHGR